MNPEQSGSPVHSGTGSDPADPLDLGRHRRTDATSHQLKSNYPNRNQRKLKRFYAQQNGVIDQLLGAEDEERLQVVKMPVWHLGLSLPSTPPLKQLRAVLDPSVCGRINMVPIVIAKASLMLYCLFYHMYPSVHVFYIDHRNDIVVNSFGLTLSIIGNRVAWLVDAIEAIIIILLILFSWMFNAIEKVWLLASKSAPRDFISKLIYLAMTHDSQIAKVDTASHDVIQSLRRKFEGSFDNNPDHESYHTRGELKVGAGLCGVERAFVHVDYDDDDDDDDICEEHKKLYKVKSGSQAPREIVMSFRRPQG
ncbi:hypothetical protein F4859DRAFT_525170 [Xylaria cf. heliscus]|nr:hypothetical protein F4859DRAFT_525170 [Xylaria cf. heliscus]